MWQTYLEYRPAACISKRYCRTANEQNNKCNIYLNRECGGVGTKIYLVLFMGWMVE